MELIRRSERVVEIARLTCVVLATLLLSQTVGAQTLSYASGQNISPGYEGWEEDADGSRWFVFGYMNRNWDEEPNIPVGPDNSMEPGGPDLGQPTHFLPRRNRFVFRVPVPNGFETADELVWTLTVNGVTERAYATLRPDYFMDAMIRASEHGAIGAGFTNDTIRANKMPTLSVEGESMHTVRVGQRLTLRATASDDGVPESPRKLLLTFRPDGLNPWVPHQRGTVNSETGLRVSWFVYRGDGVNGNRKPHICGNRKPHTPGEDVSGGADILPVMPVGRFGLDAGSGATGVLANTRREASDPAVTLRLPHAVRPTLSSASADAPASGSCCPGC